MSHMLKSLSRVSIALAAAALLAWPSAALAQTASGQASAVRSTVLGSTTVLAGTGPLAGADDALEASWLTASIPMLGGAEVLHAAAISSVEGDASYSVASEASLANLGLSVAGNSISAAFVMARAVAPVSGSSVGRSDVEGLAINGVSIVPSGASNQTIPIYGGRVVLNEQQSSTGGIVVNALHVIVDGLADVVIASAAAGAQPASSTLPLPLPPLF